MKSIGKTLQNGKYLLEQEIGEGGFGLTYKAIDRNENRVVVIKTLNATLRQDPNLAQVTEKFKDEAERLKKFSHPNIVRVNEFFIEDKLPYIVMEYIEGPTLDRLVLPDKPLSEKVAIKYIRQIGQALKVVHENGLIHRDVKPHNIIQRRGTSEVVLIDFGISRDLAKPVHTQIVSEGYAPPEQYYNDPRTKKTPATDIYGLAATLYTLLSAAIPISSILRNSLSLPSPKDLRPEELSDRVSNAVMRGMELKLEHRPKSIDEWLALLPEASEKFNSRLATFAVIPRARNASGNVLVADSSKNSKFRKSFLIGTIASAGLIIAIGYAWSRVQPKFSTPNVEPTNEGARPQNPDSLESSPETQTPLNPDLTGDPNLTPSEPPQFSNPYEIPNPIPSEPPQFSNPYEIPNPILSEPPRVPTTPNAAPPYPPQQSEGNWSQEEINRKIEEKRREIREKIREKREQIEKHRHQRQESDDDDD